MMPHTYTLRRLGLMLGAALLLPMLLGNTMCGKTEDERSAFKPDMNPMQRIPKDVQKQMDARQKNLERSLERSLNERPTE